MGLTALDSGGAARQYHPTQQQLARPPKKQASAIAILQKNKKFWILEILKKINLLSVPLPLKQSTGSAVAQAVRSTGSTAPKFRSRISYSDTLPKSSSYRSLCCIWDTASGHCLTTDRPQQQPICSVHMVRKIPISCHPIAQLFTNANLHYLLSKFAY